MNNRRSSFFPPINADFRRSSFFPANNGEFISTFTAPAVPNISTQGVMLHKPIAAEAAFIPRSPLPPQKLAKLANALGISTPLPASSPSPSASKKTFSTPRSEELTSPESKISTPASASGSSTPSRYLIHVIPPKRFPHESRKQDPEAFATFRRGSLVPLHATLQAQISAIAREHQLPTTHGIVLYLVDERESGSPSRHVLGKGPRIGEDVWRWLWAKVGEEQPVMRGVGLGLSSGTTPPTPSERPLLLRKRSSPARLDLQRVALPPTINFPLTPSPSTPSTDKSANTPPEAKQEDMNSSIVQSNHPQYPNSSSSLSSEDQHAGQGLDARLLSGLGSPSLIPVLAKIEFDIDRKIGTWYDTWCRSRKSKHKRRTRKVDAQGKVQLQITLNDKQGSIDQSSSSSDSDSEPDDEAEYARLSDASDRPNGRSPRKDPLADVFGSDGETWSEIQSGRRNGKTKGGLALDGASLSTPLEQNDHERSGASEDEVVALWNTHNQPHLQRGKVPAPLDLGSDARNIDASFVSSSSTGGGDFTLPYLTDKRAGVIYDDLELDLEDIDIEEHRAKQLKMREELDILEQKMVQLSPRALKSVDLSSNLPPSEGLLLRSAPPQQSSFSSSTAHAHHGGSQSVELASGRQGGLNSSTSDNTIGPPVFKQPALVGTPSPDVDSFKGPQGHATGSDGNVMYDTSELQAAWPAVPYSTIISRDPTLSPTTSMKSLKTGKHPNSPPKVILNGHATDNKRKNSSSISSMLSNISGPPREASESRARIKQYEEEAAFYADTPKLQPSLTRRVPEPNGSPVLPLSPDPFGRFPSTVNGRGSSNVSNPPERTTSLARDLHGGQDTSRHSQAPSSRFSIDSVADEQPSSKASKGNSLVSMKSLRKLWRKSDKPGNSVPPSPDPSTLPSRPTSTVASMRDTETDISRTPSPSVPFPSGSTRSSQKPSRSQRDSGLDPFYFDQDTKLASRKTPSPSPQMAYQFPRNGTPQGQAPGPGQTPTTEKKRSVRKSLVSKWKNGSEGSSSTDSGSDQRRRRPSVLDVSGLTRNGGNGSISSASILNSPSVPDLPAEYRMSQHSRMQSRGSISTMLTSMTSNTADDRVPARRKPTAQSSTDSSQESVDPLPTPVSGVSPLSFGKMGKGGKGSMSGSVTLSLASPGEASDGMRSSFDDSQFEMLTPPPNVGQKFPRPIEMVREART